MEFKKSTYLGDRPTASNQPWVTDFPLGRPTATPRCRQTPTKHDSTSQGREPSKKAGQILSSPPTLYTTTLAARRPTTLGGTGFTGRFKKDRERSFRARDQVPQQASLKDSVNGSLWALWILVGWELPSFCVTFRRNACCHDVPFSGCAVYLGH